MLDGLRAEIRQSVRRCCSDQDYKEAVHRVLTRPGFALHPEARCTAGLVCLETYQAIRGGLESAAWSAAAAVELYIEASFLFDHVADQQIEPDQAARDAEELALAITLMNCGTAAASEAVRRAGCSQPALNALLELSRHTVSAASGQFMDARLQRREVVATDEALEMTSLKAGSCGRLAATFGAGVAGADPSLVELFGSFGSDLYTYLQLVDDLQDACWPEDSSSDIRQHKKSVPLVFFYNSLSPIRQKGGDGIIFPLVGSGGDAEIRQMFHSSGANEFGAVVAESLLNRAKSRLADVAVHLDGVENLENLVSSLPINESGGIASN